MDQAWEYHPTFKRYIVGLKEPGSSIPRTLLLTSVGYSLAHLTRFRASNASIGVRAFFAVPIFMAACGWNLAFEDDALLAANRNNQKEKVHQQALGAQLPIE